MFYRVVVIVAHMNTGGKLRRTIAPDEEPSLVIILMLAQLEDIKPEDVPPLFDSINLEALDALITHPRPRTGVVQCEFRYDEYKIELTKNQAVTITIESIN
jgi:hypothetical protein